MSTGMPAARRGSRGRPAIQPLLDLDPEIGQLLPPERALEARRHATATVTTLRKGRWTDAELARLGDGVVVLIIVDGVFARQLSIEDTVCCELLGPGDVVRPRPRTVVPDLVEVDVHWTAHGPLRVAVVGEAEFARLMHFPEIVAMLLERLAQRSGRLAVMQAISQLNRVDRRLLTLFHHLAERWGRVAPDGIVVPLQLPHRVIGELIGARRPTVSSALAELARDGRLERRDDGTWLIARDAFPSGEAAA